MPPLPVPPAPTASTVDLSRPVLPTSVLNAAHSNTWLLSWWLPGLLGAALLLSVGFLLWRGLRARHAGTRRRHLLLRRVGAGLSLISLSLLASLASVNAYAGYLPNWSALRNAVTGGLPDATGAGPVNVMLAGGQQLRGSAAPVSYVSGHWRIMRVQLPDPALGIGSRDVLVALPPGYDQSTQQYGVIYALSGFPGRPSDWFDAGRILPTLDSMARAGLAPYQIVVAPDVNGGFLTDSESLNAVNGPQVETWLTHDVVGWVDSHLRTVPDRAHRVLLGMSSGGFASINIALRQQDTFGIALGLEPYGDPGNVSQRLLGGSADLLHTNSPNWYVPTMAMHRVTPIFFDSGSASQDARRIQELATLYAARHQPARIQIEKGQGHTWAEAAAGLPYALAFAAQQQLDPALLATYPVTAFPVGHRTELSLILSPDAQKVEAKKARCESTYANVSNSQRNSLVVACLRGQIGSGS